MIQLNTLNTRPSGIHEGLFLFSRVPIALKPQETGTLNVQELPVISQNPSLPSRTSTLLLSDIGWTQQQAAEIRASLTSFEEDWSAPGMEGYDEL